MMLKYIVFPHENNRPCSIFDEKSHCNLLLLPTSASFVLFVRNLNPIRLSIHRNLQQCLQIFKFNRYHEGNLEESRNAFHVAKSWWERQGCVNIRSNKRRLMTWWHLEFIFSFLVNRLQITLCRASSFWLNELVRGNWINQWTLSSSAIVALCVVLRWLWSMENLLNILNEHSLIDVFFLRNMQILFEEIPHHFSFSHSYHPLLLQRLECLQNFPPSINSFNHNCGRETRFCFWSWICIRKTLKPRKVNLSFALVRVYCRMRILLVNT